MIFVSITIYINCYAEFMNIRHAEVENTHKKITSVKKNLGSVNWRDSKFPVITYEGKTFETDKKFPEIKLIYTIVIKDEADISDSEKDEYVDGIKISVAHEVK